MQAEPSQAKPAHMNTDDDNRITRITWVRGSEWVTTTTHYLTSHVQQFIYFSAQQIKQQKNKKKTAKTMAKSCYKNTLLV